MFSIAIDSENHLAKGLAIQPSVSSRNYGFDFGTQQPGEYKLTFSFSSYNHNVEPEDDDLQCIYVTLGSQLFSFEASDVTSSLSSNLIGFVTKSGQRQFISIDSNPKMKVKLNNTASQFNVQLKKADGGPVDYEFKYRMILSFEKCSCKH